VWGGSEHTLNFKVLLGQGRKRVRKKRFQRGEDPGGPKVKQVKKG